MKNLLLFWLVCAPVFGFAQTVKTASFETLKALEGAWCLTEKIGETTIETWKSVNDSLFQITTISTNNSDTSLLETIRVERTGDAVFYRSTVAGQNGGQAVSFKMVENGPDFWIFENPAHDFPQRIIYRKEGAYKLNARIEGPMNGELKRIDFPY